MTSGRSRGVRRHARRVALVATLIAGGIYVAAATISDVFVLDHVSTTISGRLAARLELERSVLPRSGIPVAGNEPSAGDVLALAEGGDVDDAPIFLWWRAANATRLVPLEGVDPVVGKASGLAGSHSSVSVSGHSFDVERVRTRRGELIAATSNAQLGDLRANLLLLEGVLLPVVLLLFFALAYAIGRNAASPIERTRREQLEFTADASHELRTPLAVIEAELGVALATQRDATGYRDSLERVASESRRLRGIVDDLLWLARVDALPDAPEREPIEVSIAASTAAERFHALAARRGISVHCEVASGKGAVVLAPPDWIDRLFSVLIDNACRYCTAGGNVHVRARRSPERVVVYIDDSGPGIPPDAREDVIRRFHRATSVPGGAGLGLAIADTIVLETGGTWQLEDSPEGGTRVAIFWPLDRRLAMRDGRHDVAEGRHLEASGESKEGFALRR